MVHTKRHTCKAKTTRGTRCSRIAVEDGMCRQHFKQMTGHKSRAKNPLAFSKEKVMAPTKGCPPGMEKRKGYVRRSFVRSDGTSVHGSKVEKACIPDRGAKGRAWKLKNKTLGIGKLKKGELSQFGYTYSASNAVRNSAVKKASMKYGPLAIERKLNALAVYNSKRFPERAKIYKADSLVAAVMYSKSRK